MKIAVSSPPSLKFISAVWGVSVNLWCCHWLSLKRCMFDSMASSTQNQKRVWFKLQSSGNICQKDICLLSKIMKIDVTLHVGLKVLINWFENINSNVYFWKPWLSYSRQLDLVVTSSCRNYAFSSRTSVFLRWAVMLASLSSMGGHTAFWNREKTVPRRNCSQQGARMLYRSCHDFWNWNF